MSPQKENNSSHANFETAPDMVRGKVCGAKSETQFKRSLPKRAGGGGEPLPSVCHVHKSETDSNLFRMTLEGRLFFMFVVELVLPNFVIENIFIGFVNISNLTRILPSEKERFPALLRRIFLFSCKLEAR